MEIVYANFLLLLFSVPTRSIAMRENMNSLSPYKTTVRGQREKHQEIVRVCHQLIALHDHGMIHMSRVLNTNLNTFCSSDPGYYSHTLVKFYVGSGQPIAIRFAHNPSRTRERISCTYMDLQNFSQRFSSYRLHDARVFYHMDKIFKNRLQFHVELNMETVRKRFRNGPTVYFVRFKTDTG